MLTRAVAVAAAALLAGALPGCGDDEPGPGGGSAAATGASGTQQRTARPRPQLAVDLRRPQPNWPRLGGGTTGARFVDGGYRVRVGDGDAQRVPAPRRQATATQSVFLETTARLGPAGGAGLFCRGAAGGATGYEYVVTRAGRWRVDRVANGQRRALGSGTFDKLERGKPGRPVLLRMVCGSGAPGKPASVGFSINARPVEFVADSDSVAPARGQVGVVVAGRGEAVFRTFAAYFSRLGQRSSG